MATDEEIRDRLRDAIDDLRSAAERLQGKKSHSGRNTTLLIAEWRARLFGSDGQLKELLAI